MTFTWPSIDCRQKKPHWWYRREHQVILIEDELFWDYTQCIRCSKIIETRNPNDVGW